MSQKSISEVIFFFMSPKAGAKIPEFFEIPTHNGKPVYKSWPRLLHHDRSAVDTWFYRRDLFELKEADPMTNEFSPDSIVILDHINTRHYSAKVPQAAIYCKDHDCYLQFDFRADGLVELLCDFSVIKGAPGCNMSFMYKGSNYYFVPTEGSFQEYKKSFEQSTKPKSKQTTQVDIGVPFIGSFNDVYKYLGEFDCTQDDEYRPDGRASELVNYAGQKVYVYHSCRKLRYPSESDRESENPNFYIAKSKMNVKVSEIPEDYEIFDTDFHGVVISNRISKGSYSTGYGVNCEVDFENHTVKYVSKLPVNNQYKHSRYTSLFD